MSQWGAYGRAVNGRQSWTTILNAYYGGTTLGSVSTASRVRVRLVGHDGDATVGVISTSRTARWGTSTTSYAAMQARATATANRYDIWAQIDGRLSGGDDDRLDTGRRQRRRAGDVRDDGQRVVRQRPRTCSACAPTTGRSRTTAGGSN